MKIKKIETEIVIQEDIYKAAQSEAEKQGKETKIILGEMLEKMALFTIAQVLSKYKDI